MHESYKGVDVWQTALVFIKLKDLVISILIDWISRLWPWLIFSLWVLWTQLCLTSKDSSVYLPMVLKLCHSHPKLRYLIRWDQTRCHKQPCFSLPLTPFVKSLQVSPIMQPPWLLPLLCQPWFAWWFCVFLFLLLTCLHRFLY